MDPIANITQQRSIAAAMTGLAAKEQCGGEDGMTEFVGLAEELAELVTALDEWRTKGGFDPYEGTTPRLKLNVWQVESLAEAMTKHDKEHNATDNLMSAYADISVQEIDGERIVVAAWEDAGHITLWGDGTDCSDEYADRVDTTVEQVEGR